MDGEGGDIGPDLTLSRRRDPAAVLRDILYPNASINPDFVSFEVTLKDGAEHTGVVQAEEEGGFVLRDAAGGRVAFVVGDIRGMRPASVSLMPEGLAALGEEALRDVAAFLCAEQASAGNGSAK
jgi:putative heme-binding domain-containing protein